MSLQFSLLKIRAPSSRRLSDQKATRLFDCNCVARFAKYSASLKRFALTAPVRRWTKTKLSATSASGLFGLNSTALR